MNLQEAIQQLASAGKKFAGKNRLCTVSSVSGSTCDVVDVADETEILGVRLQAETSNGILLIPSVGSVVMVSPINDFEYAVVLFSSVDKITLLDGSFGGLIKINDLVTKVNNLENQLNTVLSTLKSVVIPLASSGTYPFAPVFASINPLTPTQVPDIENPKIVHGTI